MQHTLICGAGRLFILKLHKFHTKKHDMKNYHTAKGQRKHEKKNSIVEY